MEAVSRTSRSWNARPGGGRPGFDSFPTGADGGRTLAPGPGSAEAGSALEVEAIDIPELLRRETYDFVKMDIEGAERAVIPASAGALGNVSHIFVEYHGNSSEKPALASVVGPLEEAGFRIQVHTVRSPDH